MLVKAVLEQKISMALESAMSDALSKALEVANNTDQNRGVSPSDVARAFAESAKSCAGDIAEAIDEYIKSATITLNAGTLMTPLLGLMSPVGPVTGVITLASPTTLTDAIS